jgi:hypothetical protein
VAGWCAGANPISLIATPRHATPHPQPAPATHPERPQPARGARTARGRWDMARCRPAGGWRAPSRRSTRGRSRGRMCLAGGGEEAECSRRRGVLPGAGWQMSLSRRARSTVGSCRSAMQTEAHPRWARAAAPCKRSTRTSPPDPCHRTSCRGATERCPVCCHRDLVLSPVLSCRSLAARHFNGAPQFAPSSAPGPTTPPSLLRKKMARPAHQARRARYSTSPPLLVHRSPPPLSVLCWRRRRSTLRCAGARLLHRPGPARRAPRSARRTRPPAPWKSPPGSAAPGAPPTAGPPARSRRATCARASTRRRGAGPPRPLRSPAQ